MIKIVAIGKVKDKHLDALIQDYCKRINRYHKLQVVEVKDEAIINDEKALLDKEASRALKQIGKDEYVILLLQYLCMKDLKMKLKTDQEPTKNRPS